MTWHDYDDVIAGARDEEVVYFNRFGSYQGEFVLVTRGERGGLNIFKEYYGSCSGCDSLEAFRTGKPWEMEDEEWWTRERMQEFAEGYTPFLTVSERQLKGVLEHGDLVSILPGNVEDGWSRTDWSEVEDDLRNKLARTRSEADGGEG